MKTLIVESNSGTKRIQVPDNATVTFGGLIPGAKVDSGSNRTALRVYTGKLQIAVFTAITEWRFLEQVTVLEKRVQTAQKSVFVEEDGVQKARNVTVTSEDWVNPDEVKQTSDTNIAARALLKAEVNEI